MFVLTVQPVGIESLFTLTFDDPQALVRWLRQTASGRTKRLPVARVVSVSEEN